MLLLASTSDLLRVVTSNASALDVQVSGMDMEPVSTDRPVGYRLNTAISSVTTTTIAGSPGAGVIRSIKTISLRNKGGSTNVVTIIHTDGTTAVEVIEAVLAPDCSLHYHENASWWITDSQGRAVTSNVPNAGITVSGADTVTQLSGDVTNNNASANTMADVTGLSFSVLANKLYWFVFHIVYTAAATTTGSRWSISGPASPTYLDYASWYALTSTTRTENNFLQAYDQPASSNATSATTGNNYARIEGVIQPASDGTVIARFASEVSNSAIVAKIGSFVRSRQITA